MGCIHITFPYNPFFLSDVTLLRSKHVFLASRSSVLHLQLTINIVIVHRLSAMNGIVQDSKKWKFEAARCGL
jgi:hypothetical protein